MRTLRAMALSALLGVGASCTFGGIADYEVQPCTPADTPSADVCNRLDPKAGCSPFQCDSATKHCVRRARDDDGDGDASKSCGGGDCDDADPKNRSGSVEICDGKDNNCDGIIDEGVVIATLDGEVQKLGTLPSTADVSFAGSGDTDVVAGMLVSTSGGTCIQVVKMQGKKGFLYDGCSFLAGEASLVPRQPHVLLAESGGAALFVQTSGCKQGQLAYRFSATVAGKTALACSDSLDGVALPSLAFFDDGSKGAIALWYDVSLSARDALEDCATAASAPLRLSLVDAATTANPTISAGVQRTLATDSISIRQAGVATLKGTALALVAAPSGSGVGVWALDHDELNASTTMPAGALIPDLIDARGAVIATSPTGAVAVVAELGCPGAQSVKLAVGSVDAGAKSVSFTKSVEVAPQTTLATGPSVAWVTSRNEWVVSWLASGALMRVRRFTAGGTPIGEAFDVMSPAGAGVPASDGKLYVFDATSGQSRFSAYALGCNK